MIIFTRSIYASYFLICAFLISNSNRNQELELKDRGEKIENVISFSISDYSYTQFKDTEGLRMGLNSSNLVINNDSIRAEDLHTRGQSSQFFRRKSISFSLADKAEFVHGSMHENMKKFEAISLSMDKYYYCNRLAFALLKELGIFHLFNTYAEIKINGIDEGIYLIIERPQDWAIKSKNSPFLIRRGYNQKIDKIKTGKDVKKNEIKNYKKSYSEIYSIIGKYKGKALYDELSKILDLESYMKWLGFNYLVKNGDYTDEIYFYINPNDNRFEIVPWDYDDIFANAPHEGIKERSEKLGDRFLFSSEDELDIVIGNDAFLYEKYLIQLKSVLNKLSDEVLKHEIENTYAELYPYYSNPKILSMVRYDSHPNATLVLLKKSLEETYSHLMISRNYLLSQLD